MSTPKISVVMPNYNCEKYLSEAIESILNQSFTDFEFIIVDDGSTDNSWDIIQEYAKKDDRIVAIKNKENSGVSISRNNGLDIAKGEYIATMDSDDISVLNRFEKQVKFLDKNHEVGIVGGTMEIMDEDGKVYSKRKYNITDKEIRKKIFRYSPFCHATTIFRKNIIEKIGKYNIYLPESEDYELFFRIGKISKFANLNIVTYKMRVNPNGLTLSNTKRMESLTLYVRKKAVLEYGYKMSFGDIIYYYLQLISMYIIPGKFKVWLFNLIRNK